MNKAQIAAYLESIDQMLSSHSVLYIYGSAAYILLDQPNRTSLDIDVAGPYSEINQGEFKDAAQKAGIPVNPEPDYAGDHIEWVGSLRLCLPPPIAEKSLTLWQGKNLVVKTGSVADLIASKLIRYDEIDQSDIQYLLKSQPISFETIQAAVKRLPQPFADDPMLNDNLANLCYDIKTWRARNE